MAKLIPAAPASASHVAEVCLYGASHVGFAFYARVPSGFVAEGGWSPGHADLDGRIRCQSEAIWLAVEALRLAGHEKGVVRFYAPGGLFFAEADLGEHIPASGSLKWKAAA